MSLYLHQLHQLHRHRVHLNNKKEVKTSSFKITFLKTLTRINNSPVQRRISRILKFSSSIRLYPVLKDYSEIKTDEAIAGKPHVDLYLHKLRCFVALNDINQDNGATVYYNKSLQSKILKKYHTNLFLIFHHRLSAHHNTRKPFLIKTQFKNH